MDQSDSTSNADHSSRSLLRDRSSGRAVITPKDNVSNCDNFSFITIICWSSESLKLPSH